VITGCFLDHRARECYAKRFSGWGACISKRDRGIAYSFARAEMLFDKGGQF